MNYFTKKDIICIKIRLLFIFEMKTQVKILSVSIYSKKKFKYFQNPSPSHEKIGFAMSALKKP